MSVLRAQSPTQLKRSFLDTAANVRGEDTSLPTVVYSNEWEDAQRIMSAVPRGKRLPVTLLTGFLGAGKTVRPNLWSKKLWVQRFAKISDTLPTTKTVLNYILGCDHGLRICVVVNELGEIDIDSLLVEGQDDTSKAQGETSSSVSCFWG